MADCKETPLPEKEELKEFVVHATEVLKEESVDQVLRVVQTILKNLGINHEDKGTENSLEGGGFAEIKSTTPKLCQCHCHDAKLNETPPPVLQQLHRNLHSRLDQEAHPMQSDLILKKIFEHCSAKTLMSCRLVCRKWLTLSLKSWRQKAVLGVRELIDQNIVEDIIRHGSEFRKNPFKSYDVMNYKDTNPRFYQMKNILDTFSSSIQYLEIYSDDFDLIMPLILSKLPGLRHVKLQFFYDGFLRQCQSRRSRNVDDCPFKNIGQSNLTKLQLNFGVAVLDPYSVSGGIPWQELFKRVPALTYLQLKYDLESPYSGSKRTHLRCVTEILEAVQNVRKKENFTTLNLEELDIMFHANHSSISIPFPVKISCEICKSKFPLERLHMDIGTYSNKWSTIAIMLSKHEKTLKYMKAISAPNKNYLKKKLNFDLVIGTKVQLEKLTELELLNGCVWAFHFLNCLAVPESEVLKIEEMKLSQHRRFQKLSWKSVDTNCREEHLKSLLGPLRFTNLRRFYYSGPRHFSPKELQLLAKGMPNVTDLGVPLSAKTFPVVCELWPDLKSLQVGQVFEGSYPLIDDYAITGLPMGNSQCKSSRNKNITDMSKLWSFVLEGNDGQSFSRRPMITDVSALHAFLQLPKLVILRLYAICKFSPEVRAALDSHMWDIYVHQPESFEDEKSKVKSGFSSDDESESNSEYSDTDSY